MTLLTTKDIIFFIFCPLIIGLSATSAGLYLIKEEIHFHSSTIEIPGKIVKIVKHRCRASRSLNDCYDSTIAYTYKGNEYQRELPVTSFSKIGDNNILLLEPKKPTIPEFKYSLERFFTWLMYFVLFLFGIAFSSVGPYFILYQLKKKKDYNFLLLNGKKTTGKIIKKEDDDEGNLEAEFTLASGEKIIATRSWYDPNSLVNPDGIVTILYNSAKPTECLILLPSQKENAQ